MIVAMPGVPREMKRMWEQEAIPRLRPFLPETVLLSRNIRTIGIGESSVEEVLGDLVHGTNPTVATYAKDDGVHVRVTAKARTTRRPRLRSNPLSRRQSAFSAITSMAMTTTACPNPS